MSRVLVPRAYLPSMHEYAESVECIDYASNRARLLVRDGTSQDELWESLDNIEFEWPSVARAEQLEVKS